MDLGYGNPTMRFPVVTVAIVSPLFPSWNQAYGLRAATAAERPQYAASSRRCASSERPRLARKAFSTIG